MPDLSGLLRNRIRMIRGILRTLPRGFSLKIGVIAVNITAVLVGLFFGFFDGFAFVRDNVPELFPAVSSFLFGIFFLALLLMLAISCGVILFGGLYRGKETSLLYVYPLNPEHLFSYKLVEAVFWASWAFVFLSMPLLLAYGIVSHAPPLFYPGAFAFLLPFVLLAGALGALGAIFVTAFFLAHRKRVFVALAASVVLFGGIELVRFLRLSHTMEPFSQPWLIAILEGAQTARGAFVPSGWITSGILAFVRGQNGQALYFFLLLLSNALFFALLAVRIGGLTFQKCYDRAQGISSKRRFSPRARRGRVLAFLFPYLSIGEREIVLKDLRTFRRDPAQWSQFLIFFGLLAIYFINIRRMGYDAYAEFWKNLVSFLNMAATSMTMATFTSRFVFPQVSLEGKRFWVLGLAPLDRRAILRSKFAFSATACTIISVGLISISDTMLSVKPFVFVLHIATMLAVSLGLSGLAVGLGARFPSLREDNPSKIVAGFGGTLNLVLSAFYVAFIVSLFAVPCHLYYAAKSLSLEAFRTWISAGIVTAVIAACVATLVPYGIGARAFARMEI